MILVSACLVGINCNYKGKSKPSEKVIYLVKKGKAIPVCPEQLGGLPTPRYGARIVSGDGENVLNGKSKLITDRGEDVTQPYLKGAYETLKIAQTVDAKLAILKEGSPSCGSKLTQGGSKFREKIKGKGVTTALLERNGIKVLSEEDIEKKEVWEKILATLFYSR